MKVKAIRVTMYAPHDLSPTTVVMREGDITMSLTELIEQTMNGLPGVFHVFDTFETEDDIIRATIHGQERVRPDEEANMAILYYWTTGVALSQVSADGVVVMPRPAPLKKADIIPVIDQVKKHRAYKNQRILMTTEDQEMLEFPPGDKEVVVTRVPAT